MKREELKSILTDLIKDGQNIFSAFCWKHYPEMAEESNLPKSKNSSIVHEDYHTWFTSVSSMLKGFAPELYNEFIEHYYIDKKRKNVIWTTYKIQDWLMGTGSFGTWERNDAFFTRLQEQLLILKPAVNSFDHLASSIGDVMQAELFDSEIDAANDLLKKKHLRAAGIITGVVLEGHLKAICAKHNIKLKKKATIANLNDALKKEEVIDVPTWRHIQLLGDIRNLCGHKKERPPKEGEIEDIISGTKKIISTVF
jgi:hypothetical protein